MRESEGGLCAILRGVLLIDFEEVLGLWGGQLNSLLKQVLGLGGSPSTSTLQEQMQIKHQQI
jgi:hypothetical protein